MKKIMAIILLLGMLTILAACGASQEDQLNLAYTAMPLTQTQAAMDAPSPTPMPEVLQFAVAVEQAKATAAAVEATQIWIYGQLTATQVAKEEAATKQAAAVTQQAFAVQSTATHEAFVVQQAATDRSWYVTGTAQAQGTATAYPMTSTAQAWKATATERAWIATATLAKARGIAQETAAAGDAESVNMAVERERVTNMTRAWVPWMAFAVAMGLIFLMGYRWSKVRVIQRDAFGALPGLVMDGEFRDPDREPGPDQETTVRAQIGQMVRALPAGRSLQDVPQLTGSSTSPRIEIVDADVVGGWIEDVTRQADEMEA